VFGVVAQEAGLFAQPLVGGLGFVVGAAMIGARYFPHGCPISIHTSIRTLRVLYPYVRARGLRCTDRAVPLRLVALVIARRALARDQPVTATSSASIRPLSFFEARAYCLAYFFVIS
jgi:hypothetical protein